MGLFVLSFFSFLDVFLEIFFDNVFGLYVKKRGNFGFAIMGINV